MATIRCDIVSAEAEIFHGEAELVVATGEMGELGIAPKHAPLITRLKPGKIVVHQPGGETVDIAVSGGILEVQPTVVTVLADTAVRAQDIDEAGTPLYTTRSYREGTQVWTDALDAFAVSNRVRAPGIVVRRRAYEEVGGYRTDLPHAADWEMWTRLAAHGPVVFVDEVLARYRKHDGSHTSTLVRSGANVRERVTAIGAVSAHVDPARQASTVRRALAHSVYFAGRSSFGLARSGDWTAARRQAREAARCAALIPTGIEVSP